MLRNRIILFLRIVVAGAYLARSPGCEKENIPANITKGIISSQMQLKFHDPNLEQPYREYAIYVPNSYQPGTPVPLLVDFHGFYSSDRFIAHHDGVSLASEKEGFIVVYPDGTKDFRRETWWNNWNGGGTDGSSLGKYGETCLKKHSKYPCYDSCIRAGVCKGKRKMRKDCGCSGCSDDVGFIGELFKQIKANFCIDESRVHGSGMSNGAIFLYYLSTTDVGTQLASIAPTEGSFLLGFLGAPKVPMPVLDIHGTKDNCVPANWSNSYGRFKKQGCPVQALGKEGCAVGDDLFLYHTTEEILKVYSEVNKCPVPADNHSVPVRTPQDGNTAWSCMLPYGPSCEAEVRFCTHNLGHTWPFDEGKKTRSYP